MRILLLADPYIPVPPLHYGGIERVIFDIANQYTKMGHSVTIIAGPNSKSPGRLIEFGENGELTIKFKFEHFWQLISIFRREIKNHDVLHNFGRLAFLLPILWTKIPKVQTYMRYVDIRNVKRLSKLGVRNLIYTGVSDAIIKTGLPGGGEWLTIYNCAPINNFTPNYTIEGESYFAFLGRLERCKGAHSAIKVALATNNKLIIAGNISTLPEEIEYFKKEVEPFIDGNQIKYIGVVDNVQKQDLLANAKAMLLPIEWYEPFPIVIPESYACGTPILAFNNGGVPEGIVEGKSGFVSENVEQMIKHVDLIPQLDRKYCRFLAENNFSDKTISEKYLDVYNMMLSR